ncbi:MAG: hypothetical protein JSS14_22455 [Proteobacteria bacterium]|nr:hypothetical protein [Pseudomonadota bacterium]
MNQSPNEFSSPEIQQPGEETAHSDELGRNQAPVMGGPNSDTPTIGSDVPALSTWFERATQQVADRTASKYHQSFVMLINRTARALNVDPDFVTPAQVVRHLESDPTLRLGSRIAYRAAIVWALDQSFFEFDEQVREEGLAAVRSFNPRRSSSIEDVPDLIFRNTRTKGRSIPQDDLGPLLNSLLAAKLSKLGWATKTTAWLNAGIATGARPGEWETAFWLDRDRRILRLPNSKLKKQAPVSWAHIPQRLLTRAEADLMAMADADSTSVTALLDAAQRQTELVARNLAFFDEVEAQTDLTNEIALDSLRRLRAWELRNAGLAWRDIEVPSRWVNAVDTQIANVQEYLVGGGDQTFQKLYNGCRAALTAACKRAFPDGRLYSLYDTRSTAAANLQATIGPEVAAMVMGHYMKRKRTIRDHYAGADRAFRSAGKFTPSLADTQNQRDQAERSADQAPAQAQDHSVPSSSQPDGQVLQSGPAA